MTLGGILGNKYAAGHKPRFYYSFAQRRRNGGTHG